MNKVTTQDVLRGANVSGVKSLIAKARLRRSGHVMRMDECRLPKQLLCSKLVSGKYKQKASENVIDCLINSLLAGNISISG